MRMSKLSHKQRLSLAGWIETEKGWTHPRVEGVQRRWRALIITSTVLNPELQQLKKPYRCSRDSTYGSWWNMKHRCTNENDPNFKNYGARGIAMCDRWASFENFLADMGLKPNGARLERIDNDKGYEPGNCKWATACAQSRNKRTNVFIEFRGQRMTLTDWAMELGLSPITIKQRIDRGYPIDVAISSERIKPFYGKNRVLLKYKTDEN